LSLFDNEKNDTQRNTELSVAVSGMHFALCYKGGRPCRAA
jgi:hypothetical protein